ncbi:MAG: NAD-dependent epimerase/dehydratase family protein, partial [Actinomycetota bacterium]
MNARLALVTGGTGFVASHLIPALLGAGWKARATGRRPRPPWLPGEADYRVADLATGEGIGEALAGVTHLFHLAGASSSLASEAEMHS